MFKRLLVPLDGSRLAEAAIPAAHLLAQKAGASVALLHIIEKDAPTQIHGERHLTNIDEATAYLAEAAQRFPPDIPVECHVHTLETANVARGIADHLLELHQDTVVMAAHGHGGLHHMLFGNIAQQVVALGTLPVLLVHPDGDFTCHRILLPHDGRDLVTQRLAAARGHEHQRVPPGDGVLDDGLLGAAELPVAKSVLENRVRRRQANTLILIAACGGITWA